MTQTRPAAPVAAAMPTDAAASAAVEAPPKLQRRPYLWILGVVLVAFGGLTAAWITTSASDTTQVLALQANVDRGIVITEDDLTTMSIAGDATLDTIPASDLDEIVGQRAARDLTEGTLLAQGAVTDEVIPADGDSLLGIALTPAQVPTSSDGGKSGTGPGVQPGDTVRLVSTPRPQEDVKGEPKISIKATVVDVSGLNETGQYVVNVTVPNRDAAMLAALAATGRIAMVIDGGGA